MFLASEEELSAVDLSSQYNVYEVPNSKPGSVDFDRWGYYCATKLGYRARRYVGMFAPRNSDSPIYGDAYYSFIDRMYSYYEGTWSGGSVSFLNRQYGEENVLPARLINYPILRNKVDWLQGQFESAPVDINMTAINEEAIDARTEKAAGLVFKKVLMPFIIAMEQQTGVQLEKDKTVPADIDKYMRLTYKQIDELNMNRLIEYNFRKQNWMNEFSKGFKDVCLVGFTFHKLRRIHNQDVAWRKCNLKNMIFDWGVEDDYGKDAMMIGEERYMTLDEIEREFGLESTVLEEIKNIYQNIANGGTDMYTQAMGYTNNIKLVEMQWKASKTGKFKKIENSKLPGNYFYKMIPEGEDAKKRKGTEVKDYEKYNWYSTILIADKICVNTRIVDTPVDYDDLTDVFGEYQAMLYNRLDGKPNGPIEMLEGLQELFNEIMFALELEVATSPGKVMEYDIRTKPKNVPLTDVFYHMKANKVVQTDRSKLGLQGGSAMGGYDLSPTAADTYLNIAMFIENIIDRMTGITQFSQGNVPQDTYVGTLKTSIQQSAFTTKPIFTFYREGLRKMMKTSAAFLKQMNNGKTRKLSMMLGETGAMHFVIDGTIPFGEYDFYFNDGTEDQTKRDLLIQIGMTGMQSGNSAVIEMMKTVKDFIMKDNLLEVSAELDRVAAKFNEQQAQVAQMQQQVAEADRQAPFQMEQFKGQMQGQIEQMKKTFDLQIADLYAQAPIKKTVVEKQLDNKE